MNVPSEHQILRGKAKIRDDTDELPTLIPKSPAFCEVGPSRMNEVGRKHPAHVPVRERFNTPIIVFLTVCTKDRKKILANEKAHELLVNSWRAATSWLVGRYVIMPTHVHLFCAPAESEARPLMQWVSYWKSIAAREWPRPNDSPIWQRHFWDTQLRRDESYDEKWQYVVENPVRAGLVISEKEWPYQGVLNELRW